MFPRYLPFVAPGWFLSQPRLCLFLRPQSLRLSELTSSDPYSLVYDPPSSRSEQNLKPDPTAVSRSPIRRQGAVRRARARLNASRNTASRNSHGLPPHSYLTHLADHLHHHLHHGGRDSDNGRSRSSRETRSPLSRDALHWAPLSPNSNGRETSSRSLRDSIRHLSELSAMRLEVARPPWSIEDVSHSALPSISPPIHPFRTSHRPSLTPGFAPAHSPEAGFLARGATSSPPDDDLDISIEGTMDASMPLLRRVGHRSVSGARISLPTHHPVIDGLGDRDRSVGLDDENDIQDTWERLLTTIPPDDNLPAESSFASATATASNSLSRNSRRSDSATSTNTPASSFGTEAPAPNIMFGIYPELSVHCEGETDGSDTEPGSDQEGGRSQPRISPRRRSEGRPSSIRLSNERARDQPSQQQSDNDTDTPTASAAASFNTDNVISDLQQVHRILDHLVRRDDIPDEWWATAGLSRTIRQELNNSNNNNNNNNNDRSGDV